MTFFHEQFIQVFKDIEQNYPKLFTEADRASLADLRKTFLEQQSNETESDAIARWCKERPHIQVQIQDALLKLQNTSDSGERGPRGYKPKIRDEDKDANELLDNIVRPSESSSQSEPLSQP